jgi:hypothetical protein
MPCNSDDDHDAADGCCAHKHPGCKQCLVIHARAPSDMGSGQSACMYPSNPALVASPFFG